MQDCHKSILEGYRTIGCFASGPVCMSNQPFTLAVGCHSSFKLYSHDLKIKVVSPCFQDNIVAIATYNQYTYVWVAQQILKIQNHHIVDSWTINSNHHRVHGKARHKCLMIVFESMVLLAEDSWVKVLDEKHGWVAHLDVGFHVQGMVHPVTYVNKVLLYNEHKMAIVNPISEKVVYHFPNFTSHLATNNDTITTIVPSPLVDIVGVGTSAGNIHILNLRSDEILFHTKQKHPVHTIAFSQQQPLMASTDSIGNLLLWHLEQKRLSYRAQTPCSKPIDHVCFVQGYPLLICTSSAANTIKQLQINFDNQKILTMYRERVGLGGVIDRVQVHNNKQITYTSDSTCVYSSIYSHNGNYILNNVLCSSLPYHIVRSHFSIHIYQKQTIREKLNLHEQPQIAQISVSQKYAIIGTNSKILKVSMTSASVLKSWPITNVIELHLFHEQFIYAITHDSIYVCSFDEDTVVAVLNQGNHCFNSVVNAFGSLLAVENRSKGVVEVWDMGQMKLARQYKINQVTTCLAFTGDNRFVVECEENKSMNIWSIPHGNLYQHINLPQIIQTIAFTPDNKYMLSVFEHGEEINIWHNYIGKVMTDGITHNYHFHTQIKHQSSNYRKTLNCETSHAGGEEEDEFEGMLEGIDDAEDDVWGYELSGVHKWMPLLYYDEIKKRNTVGKEATPSSLPFFLDFNNIEEQKKSILQEVQAEEKAKQQQQLQKRDQNLKNESHEITLGEDSTEEDYLQTYNMLCTLTLAEVDYQLRVFLLNPAHHIYLLRMFQALSSLTIPHREVFNVLLLRLLDILGTSLCEQQAKQQTKAIGQEIGRKTDMYNQVVSRCLAIVENK